MRIKTVLIATAAIAVFATVALWASPSESETRKRIIETAESYQGVPYVYGAESPEAFDCSGLVQYVYAKAADLQIPRNSTGIWAAGTEISLKDAKPGDIIVFDTIHAGGPSHVAIFKGDGTIIHAVSEPTRTADGKKTGVIVSVLKGSSFEKAILGSRGFVVSMFPSSDADKASGAPVVEQPKAVVVAPAPAPVVEQPKAVVVAPAPAPVVEQPKATVPAKPAPAKSAAAPKPIKLAAAKDEVPLAQIGVEITKPHEVIDDPIPALKGTAIAFTITNSTGKADTFNIAFYKAGNKYTILRQERVRLEAGASQELSAYTFVESGIYRLNVKTSDNTQMMQRAWKVK